jgi:hypothetical protein
MRLRTAAIMVNFKATSEHVFVSVEGMNFFNISYYRYVTVFKG